MSGDHDTLKADLLMLAELDPDPVVSRIGREALARVAALKETVQIARDQETMWRERWEEKHARVAALEHVEEIARWFCAKYEGNKAGTLGNGPAREALQRFRGALAKAENP